MASADDFTMKDGKLMAIEDGESIEVMQGVTLQDGTEITRGGDVTSADGRTWKLQEGDKLMEDGTFRARIFMNGVLKENGNVLIVRAGEKLELSKETTLTDGTRVMTDGSVIPKDGEKWSLKDNDAILIDGRPLLEGSVIIKDSKPHLVKECMGEPLDEKTKLGDTEIHPDLTVDFKGDGDETALKEGDIVKPDGTILRADRTKK
ncbi:hypothetical protein OKA04_02390 [Luteolibacter flavescens]|uniref:DUF6799 domain-containing protein n=2 Tax=Luteolibacter flavescens TaxID=1859460 RepID=A0ABT3FJ17_9BACT|nr:hypothetical protein [Luteolibacter flavescens]